MWLIEHHPIEHVPVSRMVCQPVHLLGRTLGAIGIGWVTITNASAWVVPIHHRMRISTPQSVNGML
jgi:hypothetical protein